MKEGPKEEAEHRDGSVSIYLDMVSQNGLALEHLPVGMQSNRLVVSCSVSQHGGALAYASEALRADREIVMLAVSNLGLSDKASDSMKRHLGGRHLTP